MGYPQAVGKRARGAAVDAVADRVRAPQGVRETARLMTGYGARLQWRWTARRRRGTKATHEPSRRHGSKDRAAAGAARRTAAADNAHRGFWPGTSDRPGWSADA